MRRGRGGGAAGLAAALGRRLASELRAGDLVADLGDGRLGLLLAGLRNEAEGAQVIDRLRRALRAPALAEGAARSGSALPADARPAVARPADALPAFARPADALPAVALPADAPELRCALLLLPSEGAEAAALLSTAEAALAEAPAAALPADPTAAPIAPPQARCDELALLRAALNRAGDAGGPAGGTDRPGRAGQGAAPPPVPGAAHIPAATAPADAFHIAYQPIVDLATDRPVMWEALLRWHPGGRAVPTARLIALAEAQGLIGALRDVTLRLVAAQIARWQAEGRPRVVALNLSPSQCATEADLERLLGWLADPARRAAVVFEITETAPLDQAAHVARIRRLAAAGVRLALDDFGTGFSRLEHLAQLPVHFLKLPEGFLRRATDPAYARLLQTLIGLGHAQGLQVIAEGVEQPEELALLRRLGCDLAQGHLLGRPTPADADAP